MHSSIDGYSIRRDRKPGIAGHLHVERAHMVFRKFAGKARTMLAAKGIPRALKKIDFRGTFSRRHLLSREGSA
jgi:hypothetical protein